MLHHPQSHLLFSLFFCEESKKIVEQLAIIILPVDELDGEKRAPSNKISPSKKINFID
jgi:hypothetical protein